MRHQSGIYLVAKPDDNHRQYESCEFCAELFQCGTYHDCNKERADERPRSSQR